MDVGVHVGALVQLGYSGRLTDEDANRKMQSLVDWVQSLVIPEGSWVRDTMGCGTTGVCDRTSVFAWRMQGQENVPREQSNET